MPLSLSLSLSVHKFLPKDLTLDNAWEYIGLLEEYTLHTGIRRQMDAFQSE